MTKSPKDAVASTLKNPFLDKLHYENAETQDRVQSLATKFSNDQQLWKPAENSWCMLECVEHLNKTMEMYLPALSKHLAAVKESGKQNFSPFKATWFGKMFIGFILPEKQMKLKTVGVFKPVIENFNTDSVYQRYETFSNQLNRLIAESDGYALNGKKFASPASSLIRFTLGEGLWLQVAHNERHYRQAKRISEMTGFPKL